MGKQIADYLASHTPDANTLYILWGGGNDLFDDHSAQSVIDTANRVGVLIQRLANAGARNFLVPNSGSQSKKVIVRALGPTLGFLGVSSALADPTITVVNSSNVVVASNDDWRNTQAAQIAASGFAPPSDLESAIIISLPPGSYSAVVSGKNGGTGIGLVDVYELDATPSTFQDLSTRGFVGTGDNALIGGLIIGNGEQPLIVVRAIGPTLGSFGITQPLQDPTLEVRDSNGGLISFDNDWQDNTPTAVKAALLHPQDSREAAVVLSLPAGNYTAIVRGKGGTTGVALVEAYRLQ